MKFLEKYTSQDLLYIAILSAMGFAIKPVVTPLVHIISAPLMIPGGSLAGGFYMMWLALAVVIVNKPGAAFMVGLVQAIVILSLGYFGSHGAVSLISYTLPGLTAELVSLLFRRKDSVQAQAAICTSANITGAFIVTTIIMRLAFIPMLISLTAAGISGIIGGLISYFLINKLKKYRLIG